VLRSRFFWKLYVAFALIVVVAALTLGLFVGAPLVQERAGRLAAALRSESDSLEPYALEVLRRGQDAENFANLTGRQKVWDALLDAQRSTIEELFGIGLTNKSFNGLPIDSSWLTVYHEQGYVGVVLVGLFILTLLFVAALRPPSVERACAVFLIVYCLMASYTEAGLGDASPYLLYLTLAAALLSLASARLLGRRRFRWSAFAGLCRFRFPSAFLDAPP